MSTFIILKEVLFDELFDLAEDIRLSSSFKVVEAIEIMEGEDSH